MQRETDKEQPQDSVT